MAILQNSAIFREKTPALESLFDEIAGLESLQHRCFAENIVKFLRISILKIICKRLFLYISK